MSRLLRLGKIAIVVVVLLVGGQVVFGDGVGSGPNPEVVSSSKPATELVSQDARVEGDGQVFSGTIQNTENAGDIFVTLWLGSDTPEQLPDTAAGLRAEGFERVRTKTVYFDSGERRAVTFSESDAGEFESYALYGFASTYRATVENTGGDGRINVTLSWRNPDTDASHTVASKTVPVGSDTTETVEFQVQSHPEFTYPDVEYTEWRIRAEPA